jgi:signal transduction histidine kinase
MHREELLNPLNTIILASEALRSEADSELNFYQERFVDAMLRAATGMRDMLISIPDMGNAREILSYEARSNLASIIGYSEVLLDQVEGKLTPSQQRHVQAIRANGAQMLNLLIRLLNSA